MIFDYKNGIVFEFNGKELNQDKTLSELGIKNGNIIVAVDTYWPEIYPHHVDYITKSTEYILKDKNKKEEKKIYCY